MYVIKISCNSRWDDSAILISGAGLNLLVLVSSYEIANKLLLARAILEKFRRFRPLNNVSCKLHVFLLFFSFYVQFYLFILTTCFFFSTLLCSLRLFSEQKLVLLLLIITVTRDRFQCAA